jgi:hypothetical protein
LICVALGYVEPVTGRELIFMKSFLLALWNAMLYRLKITASAAMKLIVKEGTMDMENGQREPSPPADFLDCLGVGIRGVISQIEEVDPRVVRDDIGMAHFLAPCPKSFLITARDSRGLHHLLHNRQLLDEALRRGDARVRTESYSLVSAGGLALMAARFSYPFASCGEVRYSEHLRNLAAMRDELVKLGATRYTHGGDRTSERFTKEQRESLAARLAKLTGKETKTMTNWLTFVDGLSVKALDTLAAWDCRRSVYEAIQADKRALIRSLQGRNLTEEEVVEAVSKKVLELAGKHLQEPHEGEARPRTRRTMGNGRTHKADGSAGAGGNETNVTFVEDQEGNARQQTEATEEKRSLQLEQSDEKGRRLAESLKALDIRLTVNVTKLVKSLQEAPRDLGGLEVREKLLDRLFDTVMESKRELDEISLEAPNLWDSAFEKAEV